MKLEFSKNAQEEVSIAYAWYQGQRSGLGEQFLEYLETKVSFIQNNPNAFPLKHQYYRLVLLDKFPFLIVYEVLSEKVIVYHVFHTSRNPKYWMR